jgi:hypothetical protein
LGILVCFFLFFSLGQLSLQLESPLCGFCGLLAFVAFDGFLALVACWLLWLVWLLWLLWLLVASWISSL